MSDSKGIPYKDDKDGIRVRMASDLHLAMYDKNAELLDKQTVPLAARKSNPHQYLYIAAMDGTEKLHL